jgi:hypothetical protein
MSTTPNSSKRDFWQPVRERALALAESSPHLTAAQIADRIKEELAFRPSHAVVSRWIAAVARPRPTDRLRAAGLPDTPERVQLDLSDGRETLEGAMDRLEAIGLSDADVVTAALRYWTGGTLSESASYNPHAHAADPRFFAWGRGVARRAAA